MRDYGKYLVGVMALGLMVPGLALAGSDIHLNEIYASHAGTDTAEMIELIGDAGQALDGICVLIVEGDSGAGLGGQGALDRAFCLTGMMPGDGLFLLGDTGVPGFDFGMGVQDRVENGSETFYLVTTNNVVSLQALVNTGNLDTNADGIIFGATGEQAGLITTIHDLVAMVDGGFPATDKVYDGAQVLGPDGTFFPAGIFRGLDYPSPWCALFLDFDNVRNMIPAARTPGAPNVDCVSVGACCLGGGCEVVTNDVCDGVGGDYAGDNTFCTGAGAVSCARMGACCVNGTCTDGLSPTACLASGSGQGEYQGNGSTCALVGTCPATGACCYSGHCQDGASMAVCTGGGGTYPGNGTLCASTMCPAGPAVNLNEIRIDHFGSEDPQEYIELIGSAGGSLTGLTYIVIGDELPDTSGADAPAGSGTVETVIPLTGSSIAGSGYFVAAKATFVLSSPDLILAGSSTEAGEGLFEHADNLTHLLVAGYRGTNNLDLDTNDDGTLDATPWAAIVDCVALVETVGGGDQIYCATTSGPDIQGTSMFVPGHSLRCSDALPWHVGDFDTDEPNFDEPGSDPTDDSPGATNLECGGCCTGGVCTIVTEAECVGPTDPGVFLGIGTDCSAPCAVGACCDAGVCTEGVFQDVCENGGGIFQGDGVLCAADTCILGACCIFPGSTCEETTLFLCQQQGGVFVAGSDCAMAACAAIPTVSEWGVLVMALLLASAGTLVFGRLRRMAKGAVH